MSKISIKKDFRNGDKLYDVDLNNNFMVIEAGVNANEENLEEIIEEAEERLTTVFETESAATEARIAADNQQTAATIAANNQQTAQTIAADNLATKNAIIADNDETEADIIADNDATAAEIAANNAATVAEIRNLVVNEGWDWGGVTTERVRFFKGTSSAVNSQPIINGQLLFDMESGIISLDDSNSRKMLGGALWDETPKKPVKYKRKTTAQIETLPIEDGSVIYNTENGKQYMDIGNTRIPTGGAGGEVILEDETITDDTKLILEDEDLDFQGLEIANEYTTGDNVAYSVDYVNGIIESGSNTNGVYTKFADGTLICRTTTAPSGTQGNPYIATWTFPYPFIDTNYTVTGNTLAGNSKAYTTAFTSATTTNIVIHTKCLGINGTAETCDRGSNCIAIGRWK